MNRTCKEHKHFKLLKNLEELVPCSVCTWLAGATHTTAKQNQALNVISALVKVRDQGKGQ